MEKIVEVRVLPEDGSLDETAASLIAEEFQNMATYRFVFPESKSVKEDMQWLILRRIAVCRDYNSKTFGLFEKDTNQLIGCVTLGTIESQTPSFFNKAKHSLLLWPFLFGFDSLKRLDQMASEMTKASLEKNGICDFEVMMMAITKSKQHGGFGGYLLKNAMDAVCAEHKKSQKPLPIKISLSTQSDLNVKFYKKLGFEVTGEEDRFKDTKYEMRDYKMLLKVD